MEKLNLGEVRRMGDIGRNNDHPSKDPPKADSFGRKDTCQNWKKSQNYEKGTCNTTRYF